jgi:hypothetical protein
MSRWVGWALLLLGLVLGLGLVAAAILAWPR